MPFELLGWAWDAIGEVVEWLAGVVEWLASGIVWLGHLLDPAGEILATVWPPVLAGIAAVVLLRTVRWLLLLWHGRTPRVQITTFAWATSDGAGPEATWVTSLFREQLATLRLDALDPLPERAPGAPLVEIVEGVGQGVSRDIGAAAARLFRAAWPDSAYEVWGTLRPHENGGGRISVQLIERRRGNRTLLNVALEEASWEDGAREAAMAVAGALYPQVRESDRGPWTRWRRPVPPTLMGHYHAARRYEEADRLEHALAEYHAALDQDPLNPNLRLKIAMLQERLELYLDAWVTYEAIVDDSDPRAWHGPDRRAYLLALYRLSVMLSNGRVAAQWVKGSFFDNGPDSRRDRERQERRVELMRSLESNSLFTQRRLTLRRLNELPEWGLGTASFLITTSRANVLLLLLRTIDVEASKPSDALAVFRQKIEGKERERGVEAVLRILGLRRLEELEAALRIFPPLSRRWREWWIRRPTTLRQWLQPEFARSAVRTSKLLVRIRIAASLEIQVQERRLDTVSFPSGERWTKEIRQAHWNLTRRWPFPPVNLGRKTLHFLAPRRRWTNRREDSWQLHYNAGCAVASVLRRDSVLRAFEREMNEGEPGRTLVRKALPKRTDRKKVVDRAIAQLEEYAFRAGSDRVAAQADWVAIDDPDLRGLRDTSQFELWASHHLPRTLPQGLPSRKADVKRFTVRVVHEGACVFASSWRERAERDNPTAAEIVEWWRVEAEVWSALANACREHLSWQERLKWLTTLQDWLRSSEREEEIDFSHEARGTAAADSMSEGLFEELEALANERPSGNGAASESSRSSVSLWVERRVLDVREAHEAGEERADATGSLRHRAERAEALRAAQIWTRLAEALEAELAGEGNSDDDLRARIDRIRHPLSAQMNAGASPRRPERILQAARNHWRGRG